MFEAKGEDAIPRGFLRLTEKRSAEFCPCSRPTYTGFPVCSSKLFKPTKAARTQALYHAFRKHSILTARTQRSKRKHIDSQPARRGVLNSSNTESRNNANRLCSPGLGIPTEKEMGRAK